MSTYKMTQSSRGIEELRKFLMTKVKRLLLKLAKPTAGKSWRKFSSTFRPEDKIFLRTSSRSPLHYSSDPSTLWVFSADIKFLKKLSSYLTRPSNSRTTNRNLTFGKSTTHSATKVRRKLTFVSSTKVSPGNGKKAEFAII
jgi:hypothetical protein